MFSRVQEAAIDDYFKPIDKEAEIIMKVQLEGEEKTMREMVQTMQKQALLEKAAAEQIANAKQQIQDKSSAASPVDQVRWFYETFVAID